MMSLNIEPTINQAVEALRTELGENLHSCCLYGSAVRGNRVEGVSDINLLIILRESNAAAHAAVARAIGGETAIDPFILSRRGLERSMRAFAPKFASIKRNYRLLHGVDVLAEMSVDAELERFLCEQALRNLRLRLVYAFVTRKRTRSYDRFLIRNTTVVFVQFSEILRLSGIAIPKEFETRIPIFEKEFGIQGGVLRDLMELKKSLQRLSELETIQWHEKLFPVVDAVLVWVEKRWPG